MIKQGTKMVTATPSTTNIISNKVCNKKTLISAIFSKYM